jgi:hypothetical protein
MSRETMEKQIGAYLLVRRGVPYSQAYGEPSKKDDDYRSELIGGVVCIAVFCVAALVLNRYPISDDGVHAIAALANAPSFIGCIAFGISLLRKGRLVEGAGVLGAFFLIWLWFTTFEWVFGWLLIFAVPVLVVFAIVGMIFLSKSREQLVQEWHEEDVERADQQMRSYIAQHPEEEKEIAERLEKILLPKESGPKPYKRRSNEAYPRFVQPLRSVHRLDQNRTFDGAANIFGGLFRFLPRVIPERDYRLAMLVRDAEPVPVELVVRHPHADDVAHFPSHVCWSPLRRSKPS